MSWLIDLFGQPFIGSDGQPPSGYGVTVTNPNGQTGFWGGDQAIFPK